MSIGHLLLTSFLAWSCQEPAADEGAVEIVASTSAALTSADGADSGAPIITVPGTVNADATTIHGAVVTFATSATDAVDGALPVSCGPIHSGQRFPVGDTSVTCSAHDSRGNTASKSFVVKVRYNFCGFLQPINVDGTSLFRLGATVPVRFQLCGGSANIVAAPATISWTKLSNNLTGADDKPGTPLPPDTDLHFSYNREQNFYHYRLGTTKEVNTRGTWLIKVTFANDPVAHDVIISVN